MQRWFGSCFLVLLAACAAPPTEELYYYRAAFDQSQSAARVVLEVWEPIEKSQREPADATKFDPKDAHYIADEGRGGNAALIERGFAAVEAYNEVLARYAAGESIAAIKPATEAFATSVTTLSLAVGLPAVSMPATAVVQGLETLAAASLAAADRAELSRVIEENAGRVDAFLVVVRDFTPDMFRAARTHSLTRQAEGHSGAAEDLENFRKMLASWVLTIDDTRRALAALESVAAGGDRSFAIQDATYWTTELARHTEAVKLSARAVSDAF